LASKYSFEGFGDTVAATVRALDKYNFEGSAILIWLADYEPPESSKSPIRFLCLDDNGQRLLKKCAGSFERNIDELNQNIRSHAMA